MSRTKGNWQKTADTVVGRFRRHAGSIKMMVSNDARATVHSLFEIKRVLVDDLGDRGFLFDPKERLLTLGVSGLNLILGEGRKRKLGGLALTDFCEIALSLYLFHEWHHVEQGLAEFADVQTLKRTAGLDKLGELDLMADAVSAQIFSAVSAAEEGGSDEYRAASFLGALKFMIEFCFPAFKFPRTKRHKAQRALGIVIMTVMTERAIRAGDFQSSYDSPLYPTFSKDYTEMTLLSYGGAPSQAVLRVSKKLNPASVVELLELIDSGDVDAIMTRARAFA